MGCQQQASSPSRGGVRALVGRLPTSEAWFGEPQHLPTVWVSARALVNARLRRRAVAGPGVRPNERQGQDDQQREERQACPQARRDSRCGSSDGMFHVSFLSPVH